MLSLSIAARFLRKSPWQSILIAAGIAVGIGVQVFLGSLIIEPADEPGRPDHRQQPAGDRPGGAGRAAGRRTPSQIEQAMKAQSADHHRGADAEPTPPSSAAAPRPHRSSSPAANSPSSTPSTTSPARLVAGTATLGGRRPHRRQGVRRHVRAQAGRHVTLVLPERQAGATQGAGVFDFGSVAANSATALRQRRAGGERARLHRRPVLGRRRPGERRVLVRPGRGRPRGRAGAATASRSPSGRPRTPTCSRRCRARARRAT